MMNTNDITGPINIGNPIEIDIKTLAQVIIKLTKSKSEIIYKPLPGDDPIRRRPDITLAKDKLKWEPKVTLSDGLEQTIKYFKDGLGR